ncbi:hypothetical protein QE370_000468 [Aeromicrobium sp. SORGH_AS981]|uniref:hypothetical protein n=1 Tax=Aeromicrobium sp. SORGH_AS_0981 TaxID=3041802 RepID=UPI00285A12C4|nr:hypothetical protein [Aeromicrobium sp. SORGH_AS_0981]MDR6117284.1 hypothetical protein [Aeromicrobium sp. SORGH_AS_0981]
MRRALVLLLAALRSAGVWVNARRKAVVAFVMPGLVILAPTLLAGDVPTAGEVRVALVTCVLTALGVERISNRRPVSSGRH